MTARSDTQIAETFTATAVELAGDLCQASRPLLPVLQGSMLRLDELCVTSGLERQSPLAATVMALGPAVAAAGASVSLMSRMTSEQAGRLAGVAESLVDVAIDALDTLNNVGDGGEPTVAFAHRLAHATHLASALAGGPAQGWRARRPRPSSPRSGVVAQPGRVAEHAHRDQATLEGRSRVRRLDAPGAGRVRLP